MTEVSIERTRGEQDCADCDDVLDETPDEERSGDDLQAVLAVLPSGLDRCTESGVHGRLQRQLTVPTGGDVARCCAVVTETIVTTIVL